MPITHKISSARIIRFRAELLECKNSFSTRAGNDQKCCKMQASSEGKVLSQPELLSGSHEMQALQIKSPSTAPKNDKFYFSALPLDSEFFDSYPSLDPSKNLFEKTNTRHLAINRHFFTASTVLGVTTLYALGVRAFF